MVRLELRRRGEWVAAVQHDTDDAGYFETRLPRAREYRYRAYDDDRLLGVSRTASPID